MEGARSKEPRERAQGREPQEGADGQPVRASRPPPNDHRRTDTTPKEVPPMGVILHWFLPTNGDSRTDLSLGNAVGVAGSRATGDRSAS